MFDNSYPKLIEFFSKVLEKHECTKLKATPGNKAPFMNKELSKAIMNKSRLISKMDFSRENYFAYKNIKNKCNTLLRK